MNNRNIWISGVFLKRENVENMPISITRTLFSKVCILSLLTIIEQTKVHIVTPMIFLYSILQVRISGFLEQYSSLLFTLYIYWPNLG